MTLSLLIAHADETLADFFRHYYAGYGYAVETATGGIDCLNKMRRRRPDVLVLEQKLPWGGGDGVLAHMREEQGAAAVPVVLICDRIADLPGEFRQAPVAACVQRPYRLTELLKCIQDASGWVKSAGAGHTRKDAGAKGFVPRSGSTLRPQTEEQSC